MTKKILSLWPLSKRREEAPVSSYVPLQRCQWTPYPLGEGRVGVKGIPMHILLPRPSGTPSKTEGELGPRRHCGAVARNKTRTRVLIIP